MADLQDDLHPGTEAAGLDDLPASSAAEVFPPEPYAPVSDPATSP